MEEVIRSEATASHSPIGLEMLDEAWRLLRIAPRSAVVIGVGAIEVAIKEFIVHQAPEAEWLAWNSPSPPVDDILMKYLPKLGDGRARPPKRVRKVIKDGITLRNKIAHRGEKSPSSK